MKKIIINYKDHLGRVNKAERYANDSVDAEKKFKTLYPDCVIQETVQGEN